MDDSPFILKTLNNAVERKDANKDWAWLAVGESELRLMEGKTGGDWQCCVSVCSASVLQAMAVLVCAEMYQVKRLQHLCEVCVCAYLQSMPSRELASTGISVIRLLKKAKVSLYISISTGECLMTFCLIKVSLHCFECFEPIISLYFHYILT